jgi:hypothetical protein
MQGYYRPVGSMVFVIYFSLTLLLLDGTGGEVSAVGAQPTWPPCGEVGVLGGLDGAVALYDTPENRIIRLTLPAGRVVRVQGEAWHGGRRWCLVAPPEGAGAGWVPSHVLAALETTEPHFGAFRFCAGSVAAPAPLCGTRLPLPDDGLWLHWEYRALQPGDQLQRVLLVNQERYQSPLLIWSGAERGEALVNLLDHHPRLEPGIWTMQFLVNGKLIEEAQVEIR